MSILFNPRIAILITCHNRKTTTLKCLKALKEQETSKEITKDVYLVDDGSTDKTSDAIEQNYPQVKIITGTGNLFWNGGMRLAFARAIEKDYDFYLFLNDDTFLYNHALEILLTTFENSIAKGYGQAIISGATFNPETGEIVSGGFRYKGWKKLVRFNLIEPSIQPQQCDTFSGNCALIPKSIVKVIGNLESYFTHYLGDFDYGLRANQQEFTTWMAPQYIGTCVEGNRKSKEAFELATSNEVLAKLSSPKGLTFGNHRDLVLMPVKEWTFFLQRHTGAFWLIPWLFTYQKLVLIFAVRLFRLKTFQSIIKSTIGNTV